MIRLILLILIFTLKYNFSFSQQKPIYSGKFSIIEKIDKSDTLVYFLYTNDKFELRFDEKITLFEFMDILKYLSVKNKSIEVFYNNKKFKMSIHNGSDLIHIKDHNGNILKITKQYALDLSNEIEKNIYLLK